MHDIHYCIITAGGTDADQLLTKTTKIKNRFLENTNNCKSGCSTSKRWERKKTHLEMFFPEACQVHEHDPWVDSSFPVIGMTSKAVIPANARLLVLWRHSSQLARIKMRKKGPDLLDWLQEYDVCVHVEQRIHLLQDELEHRPQKTRFHRSYLKTNVLGKMIADPPAGRAAERHKVWRASSTPSHSPWER